MAQYPFPWDRFLGLMRDLPSGKRSLSADGAVMVSRMRPPPVVRGIENIPPDGPVVIVANHYQRRGLWIGWTGAVIIDAVARRRGPHPPLHWLVTGGLRWLQWTGKGSEVLGTRRLFRRVAATYGMAALPLSGARERGVALRQWIRWAQSGEAIGIFPEGLAGRSDGLAHPEPGFDGLCVSLQRRRVPFLPCAVFEEDSRLHIHFGECFSLSAGNGAGEEVMLAIARLLPAELRGVYGEARSGALE